MSRPPNLPTGTVTFLFTDIEGSTKLWEANYDQMRVALARHDRLLRQSVENHEGYVFQTGGDGFCAAFSTAPNALAGALEAQLVLAAEPWPNETPLRVRMALHTADAEERDGDYFGPSLNRVSRMLSAGHGQQTLISAATQELVRDQMPAGATLLDLGERRLKDLGRAEHIFQLLHPSLTSEFPPLRSLDNPDLPNNLPQQLSSFIGRETQIKEIREMLAKTRLLTLTGTGGAGKTRLSLQVAADLLDQYFDGVWLVELAPLSDPTLVPQALADVLKVSDQPGRTLSQTLRETLKEKRLLLVLDNCEHLIFACAALADDLLKNCPDLRILASSREPLNVVGEQTYRVPALSVPDLNQPQTLESLSQYEAVRLFIDRARSVQPTFTVIDANAPAVAQVCFHLDGIPLAIELAAARVRSLSVEEVNTRLDNRFRLLTGGSRTALPRQQTLRALIDWSYDLLTVAEKVLLCYLSVFVGGWTLAAAEFVCTDQESAESEVLDLLTGLVDKSLVLAQNEGESTRYRMLETIRQYAAERLLEEQQAGALRDKHLSWCLALAEEAEPNLRGSEQGVWLSRLEIEHDNLRSALDWCAAVRPDRVEALRLTKALWWFWFVRGHWHEGRKRLEEALAPNGQEIFSASALEPGTLTEARSLSGLGVILWHLGEQDTAQKCHENALAIFQALGSQRGESGSLNNLGILAWQRSDLMAAQNYYEQALAINRSLGDQGGEARNLGNLGSIAREKGEYDTARTCHEQARVSFQALGDHRGEANNLDNLGLVAREVGDYPAAKAYHEASLAIFRTLGDLAQEAINLDNLGLVAREMGDYQTARIYFEQALVIDRIVGDKRIISETLTRLASVARREGSRVEARDLNGQSLSLGRELNDPRLIAFALEEAAALAKAESDLLSALRLAGAAEAARASLSALIPYEQRTTHDELLANARIVLGDDVFFAVWQEALATPLNQMEKDEGVSSTR